MPAILPSVPIDSDPMLTKLFLPYQIHWIQAEDAFHARHQRVCALAEKSIRIGWTYADAFKNVRKRLRFPKRDYLFATKDYPSALEYIRLCHEFAELFNFARSIVAHGEDPMRVPRLDEAGRPTGFTDDIRIGYIKFDNGSRILAFSSNPQAMAVYGGDVGLDEFAKHPNAQILWETAQGRVTWGFDLGVWSSHDGQDTLFNHFTQQARATLAPSSAIENQKSKIENPWNLFYRVTLLDAIELGLLDTINRVQNTRFISQEFVDDCRTRSGSSEIFEQAYMCNPMGAASNHIVEYSALERCRADYPIERVHLEHAELLQLFGPCLRHRQAERERNILDFLHRKFPKLFNSQPSTKNSQLRLGFDVAASGQGDLAAIYIDELRGPELWLCALFTCRTEDWHFLKTVLYCFLSELSYLQAAGDESGLGRQICWEAANDFSSRFLSVNLASKKHDLGFALMNQLAVSEKRFPKSEQDIAADFFALRKRFTGTKWTFTEDRNPLNPASHCDIAWAGALASFAHTERRCTVGARLGW